MFDMQINIKERVDVNQYGPSLIANTQCLVIQEINYKFHFAIKHHIMQFNTIIS